MINIKERDKICFIISKIKLNLEKLKSFFSFKIIKIWIFIIMILFLFKKRINYKRIEVLTRGKNYLKICLKEKIINNVKFKKSKEPKITIIVPLYNSEPYIKKSIRSIQNQSILDIEIILVNDVSTDNTLKIIEELQKEDPRIELINNEKNMGILYSRSIGVLYSKGDYIASLAHDDFYTDDDVLETIYYNAIVGNFDIISFDFISITDYHADIYHMKVRHLLPDNFTAYQPGLTPLSSFINNQRFNVDVSIWNKLIRANNYKNSINLLGKEKYSKFCAIYEDNIIMYAISSISNSFKYIHKKGVFNYDNPRTASKKISTRKIVNMMIFFAEVIYDISKIEFKRYAVYQLLFISRGVISKYNEEYFKFVLKKFINSETLKEKYKQRLRDKFSKYLE